MVNRNGFFSIGIIAFIGGLIVLSASAGIYFYSRSKSEISSTPAPQTVAGQKSRGNMYEQALLDIESELLAAVKTGGITQENYEKMDNELRRLAANGADAGKVEILQSMLVKLDVGEIVKPAPVPQSPVSANSAPQSSPAFAPAPAGQTVPKTNSATGYSFTIIGLAYDLTDAPAMTSGTPMAGLSVRALGAASASAVTQSNGSYTLSFTNAPTGTYDICISIPSGYTRNPPSECERVIVIRSLLYDKTLEFSNNGHKALHGTAINFYLIRKDAADPSLNVGEPPLKLKGIGVNFEDFVFTKEKLEFNRLFIGFGFVIPANQSSSGSDKRNPQPTYVVPMGTKVRSIVDGIVVAIPTLWSGDFSIQVTQDGTMQTWIYEMEHLIKPMVKVGERVTAGQVVGEVSNFSNGAPPGYGAVEIGVLKGGRVAQHVCPFAYLDDTIREQTFIKLKALFTSWEGYIGDQTLYTDTTIPGCLSLDPIDG